MSAPHIARTPIEQPERIASRGPRDTQSPDAPRRAGQEFPAQPRSEDVREFRSGERRAGSSARRLDAIEPREPLTQAADTDQALRLDRQDTTPARARVELQPPELQKPSPGPVRRPRTAFHGPSCEFDRDVLVDFALPDLDLQEVTFQDINSRLVLIDFWGTWCGPCLRAIPHLVEMQRRYGPQGLQVVGIAYEHEESVPERVARVQQAREQLRINYPVLLGEMATGCPVKEKFGVHMYPTLVLLDKSGRILWKCEGVTAPKLQQLENLLKTQLANQSIGYK
jgi:thiol-disulfide isomerase/thioredoxin